MPGSSKFSRARDPVGSRGILEPAPVRSLAQPPIGGVYISDNSLLAFPPPLNSGCGSQALLRQSLRVKVLYQLATLATWFKPRFLETDLEVT